jgi:ParB-like chromosome segregation protein Spo0J
MVDTATLVPNPRNPNHHPQKQIELLAKIIKHTGWRNPIVVSNRSGFIVKGHARLEAAKLLKEDKVPVDYQDYENEAMEWADMVADNRIAELAEPSLPELKDLLESLDTGAFDMDLTGFDSKALEELMSQFHVPEDNKDIDEDAMKDTKNECPKCGFKW